MPELVETTKGTRYVCGAGHVHDFMSVAILCDLRRENDRLNALLDAPVLRRKEANGARR